MDISLVEQCRDLPAAGLVPNQLTGLGSLPQASNQQRRGPQQPPQGQPWPLTPSLRMSPKPYQVTGHSSVQNLRTLSHGQKESSNSAAPPTPRSPPTPPPSRPWSSTPNDTQPAPAHGSKARGRPCPAPFHDRNSPKSRTTGLHHVSTRCPTRRGTQMC